MNEIEVKDLVSKLSCEYPKEEQQKAIIQLSVVDEQYFGLLFNKNLKETWENMREHRGTVLLCCTPKH